MNKVSIRATFATGATIAVVATIVAGLIIAGSPSEQRKKRADEQRAQHLQQIAYAVDNFWNRSARLPESIQELAKAPDAYLQQTTDPKTQMTYEYRVVTNESYELCATFETSSNAQIPGKVSVPRPVSGPNGQYWSHNAERTCFTLVPPYQEHRPKPE